MVSITITSDNVYYQWKDTTEWCVAGSAGITIDEGDKVSTDGTGAVQATFSDDSTTTFGNNTIVEIIHSNQESQGQSGSIWDIIWDIIRGFGTNPYYFFFDRGPGGQPCSTGIRG